ncbi:siderophore-interacting protein, partial [Enterococcus faecium]
AAQPGALLGIAGAASLAERSARWLLLIGDETALPAISRLLAAAPPETLGAAYLEVAGPEEEQPLVAPPGIALHWLH